MMTSHERVTSALLQTLPLAGFHRVSHHCCGGGGGRLHGKQPAKH